MRIRKGAGSWTSKRTTNPTSRAPIARLPGKESAAALYQIDGRRVTLGDLLDANVLAPNAALTWNRPRVGATYRAMALADGTIQLDDGRVFTSPSRAAIEAAGVAAYDGWRAWQVDDGRSLADLRDETPQSGGIAEGGLNRHPAPVCSYPGRSQWGGTAPRRQRSWVVRSGCQPVTETAL